MIKKGQRPQVTYKDKLPLSPQNLAINSTENSSVTGIAAAPYYDPRSIINPAMVSTAPANLSILPNPFASPNAKANIISMHDQSNSMRGARANENVFVANAQPY